MRVEYEPSGLIAVQNLGLDPIAFAATTQVWVDNNKETSIRKVATPAFPFRGTPTRWLTASTAT